MNKKKKNKPLFIYQSLVVVTSIAKAAAEYAWFILETKHFNTFLC